MSRASKFGRSGPAPRRYGETGHVTKRHGKDRIGRTARRCRSESNRSFCIGMTTFALAPSHSAVVTSGRSLHSGTRKQRMTPAATVWSPHWEVMVPLGQACLAASFTLQGDSMSGFFKQHGGHEAWRLRWRTLVSVHDASRETCVKPRTEHAYLRASRREGCSRCWLRRAEKGHRRCSCPCWRTEL